MTNFENISDVFYENKETIGKILFIVSIILFFYLIFHPMNQHLIHGDERFTLNVINLPLNNSIDLMTKDVHPPLYYFILRFANTIVGNSNVFTNLFPSKMVSVVPYLLILLLSVTKIRKDYGWFSSGVATFTLITMSGFFAGYCTLRMYSWSLLFASLSYIYFKEVLKNSENKNWILFTVFCVLGAYTHYFTAFPSVIMFCIVLLRSYLQNYKNLSVLKEDFKKWIMSVLLAVVLYLPWLTVLLQQVTTSQKDYSWSIGYIPTAGNLTNYFTFCAVNDNNFTIDLILVKLLAIALIIVLLYLFYNNFKENGLASALTSYDGIIIYLLTILIGTIVLNLTFQPLIERYVIPAMGIFWLSFAIVLNKIKNRKIFLVLFIMCLLLSCAGFAKMEDQSSKIVKHEIHREALFDKLNHNDTIIIHTSNYRYSCYHNYFKNATQYSKAKNKWTYENDYLVEKNISKIVENNPDKKVYIEEEIFKDTKGKPKYPADIKATPVKGYDEFILLTKKTDY